jgi:ribosomal protein S18 acetylase RimI-like enzyme
MIRIMTSKDLPSIRKMMENENNFWHKEWTNDTLRKAFGVAQDLALVYEENSNIIGFVFGYNLGFRGYISALLIKKEYQKKGIGRALLNRIENNLEKKKCELIITDILPDAELFYKKLGWKKPYAKLYCKRISE